MASISALSLLFKPGPTFWSGCQRVTTRTALLGFSNPPRSRNQRYCYFQTLGRPRHLHCNVQLLIATQITPSVPQILFHGTRRLHSISEEPTNSASSSQSSSNKESSSDYFLGFLFFLLVWLGPAAIFYERGWKRGAQDLRDRLPDGKLFTERESLREEEEKLNKHPRGILIEAMRRVPSFFHSDQQEQRMTLAEKSEALDEEELEEEELEHLRQRVRVLERKSETQKASIETDVVECTSCHCVS